MKAAEADQREKQRVKENKLKGKKERNGRRNTEKYWALKNPNMQLAFSKLPVYFLLGLAYCVCGSSGFVPQRDFFPSAFPPSLPPSLSIFSFFSWRERLAPAVWNRADRIWIIEAEREEEVKRGRGREGRREREREKDRDAVVCVSCVCAPVCDWV